MRDFLDFWHGEHHAVWELHAVICLGLVIGGALLSLRLRRMWPTMTVLCWMLVHGVIGFVCTAATDRHAESDHTGFWMTMLMMFIVQLFMLPYVHARTGGYR